MKPDAIAYAAVMLGLIWDWFSRAMRRKETTISTSRELLHRWGCVDKTTIEEVIGLGLNHVPHMMMRGGLQNLPMR